MRKFLCVCSSAIAFAFPATALAQAYNPNPWITNATIATDGALYEAVKASNKYWNKNLTRFGATHEQLRNPITLYVYDEPEYSVLARGEPGAIYFSRRYVNEMRQELSRKGWRWNSLVILWVVATHERGHTLGIPHTNMGVMRAEPNIPYSIAGKWATSMIRKHR